MRMTVTSISGETFCVDCQPWWTTAELDVHVPKQSNVPFGNQYLHGGSILASGVSLLEAGLADGAQLTLIRTRCARVATAIRDGVTAVWDELTGRCLFAIRGHSGEVWFVCFSSDGGYLLTASSDCTVKLWDSVGGAWLGDLEGHKQRLRSAVFSPDSTKVLTTSDCTARLWDVSSRECILAFNGSASVVTSCAFSPDGATLLTGSLDGTARFWDVAGGSFLRLSDAISEVRSIAFIPRGSFLLTLSGHDLQIWEASQGVKLGVLRGHHDAILAAQFSPDGNAVITASSDGTARLWDVASLIMSFANLDRFNPGHARTLQCIQTFRGRDGEIVRSAAFSPHGPRVLTAAIDRSLHLWDLRTGECVSTFSGFGGGVLSMAFSPDAGPQQPQR
mmetsp:Transcript_30378/g.76819  ORF Transcript_30378/g.76819 Transcript_30378/m.76819 type:complete len:391 (-) Transcript_30378:41-1213(-)